MAGPAPTTLRNHKDRYAGPVHSSGGLFRSLFRLDGAKPLVVHSLEKCFGKHAGRNIRQHGVNATLRTIRCLAHIVRVVWADPVNDLGRRECLAAITAPADSAREDRLPVIRSAAMKSFGLGRHHGLLRDNGPAFNGRPGARPFHDSQGPFRPAGPLQCGVSGHPPGRRVHDAWRTPQVTNGSSLGRG